MHRFLNFPSNRREDIEEYVDDVGADWNPAESFWHQEEVPLEKLTQAEWRMLPSLNIVDMSMAGQTRTKGPMILDSDYSVIDGMHRLADAIKAGRTTVNAYVRVENND